MFGWLKTASKTSAREQIAIKGVRDGILVLPRQQYRAVIEVSPINFELRSEEEQDAIIDAYESFLNSIGVSLQIVVRTRELDIDKYLIDMKRRLGHEPEAIFREQLEHYDTFIRSLVQSNKILARRFYLVVPYHAASAVEFAVIREQLQVTLDIIKKGLLRLGMHTHELSSLELLDLFYSFYSPAQAKLQPLTGRALSLMHEALVKAEERP